MSTWSTESEQLALTMECPICGAEVGELCTYSILAHHSPSPHATRITKAIAKKYAEEVQEEEWSQFFEVEPLRSWILEGWDTIESFQEETGVADFRELIGKAFEVVNGRLYLRH